MSRLFLVMTGLASAVTFAGVWKALEPTEVQASVPQQVVPQQVMQSVYYAGCNDARAAGAAPLNAGEPGYRVEMDGDGDGIACEDYRGGGGGDHSRRWGRRRRR